LRQVLLRQGETAVEEVPCPAVQPGTVLVETCYSILSSGTERSGVRASSANKNLVVAALRDPRKLSKGLQALATKGLRSTIEKASMLSSAQTALGYSCAGRAIALGDGVTGVTVGQEVACAGAGYASHAEYVCPPQNLVCPVPEGLELLDAASVAIGSIALQGVRRASPSLGDNVCVIGLGLLGQLTVQLLKAAGCRTFGTDLREDRIALAESQGLDRGLRGDAGDPVRTLQSETDGHGADTTILTAATQSDEPIKLAMALTRKKGTVVVVGDVGLDPGRSPFYEKEIDLLISCSYGPGRYDWTYEEGGVDYPYGYVRWTEKRNMASYLALLRSRAVSFGGLVGDVYPIDEAAAAYGRILAQDALAVALRYPAADREPASPPRSRVVTSAQPAAKTGQLGLGVIGAGSFAQSVHLPNVRELAEDFRLVAVADVRGSVALAAAKRFGAAYATADYHEVLDDPDIAAVIVATRHNLHAPLTVEAARKGKAVLVEKPMAMDPDELDEVLHVLEETGAPYLCGFNRRFSPHVQYIRQQVSKRSCPLVATYRVAASYAPPDHWVHGPEGGGRAVGEACHMLDVFRCLVGHPATNARTEHLPTADREADQHDSFVTTVTYQDHSICVLCYLAVGGVGLPKEYLEVHAQDQTFLLDDYQTTKAFGPAGKPVATRDTDKGHLEELRRFARYVRGDAEQPISLAEMVESTELTFAIAGRERRGA